MEMTKSISTNDLREDVHTRGKLSGSIQMMLRLGLSVFSRATSFRISRNSKPSEEEFKCQVQIVRPIMLARYLIDQLIEHLYGYVDRY